jgi:cytoskeletal protein CcmA (bactofilin family)
MEKAAEKGLLTMIGAGAVLEGTLSAPHSVHIDGTLKGGRLECADTVTVGENGVVEADIRARNALIGGKVIGNLVVEERVELDGHASLTGDLKTKSLVINEGASFQGRSDMGRQPSAGV